MVEAGSASGNVIAQQAMRMLFALEGEVLGARAVWNDAPASTLGMEARTAFDAERLELLECLNQELRGGAGTGMQEPGREVCLDLLAHLSGYSNPGCSNRGYPMGKTAGAVN